MGWEDGTDVGAGIQVGAGEGGRANMGRLDIAVRLTRFLSID